MRAVRKFSYLLHLRYFLLALATSALLSACTLDINSIPVVPNDGDQTTTPTNPTNPTDPTEPTTPTVTLPPFNIAEPAMVAVSGNIAISASNLHAAAPAIQNPGTYNTVQYGANPGLNFMQAGAAYERGYFGQGVTVGFVSEYGLNPARDVLQNNLLPGLSISVSAEGAVVTGTVVSEQSYSGAQGTGLAGVVAAGIAVTNFPMGVAPLAKIIPFQIHDSGGRGVEDLSIRRSLGTGREAVSVAFGAALQRGAQVVLSPWLPFTVPAASVRISYAKTSTDILGTVIIGGDFLVTSSVSTLITLYELVIPSPTLTLTSTVSSDDFPEFCGGLPCEWFVTKTLFTRTGFRLTSGFPLTGSVAPPTINISTITDGPPQNGRLHNGLVPAMGELLENGYATGIHSPTYYSDLIVNVGTMLRGRDAVVVVPSGDGGFNSENGTVVVYLDGDLGALSVSASNFAGRGGFFREDGTLLSITDANQPGILAEAPLYNRDILGKWMVVTAIDNNRVISRSANGCGNAMYWCLAALGEGIPSIHGEFNAALPGNGTDLAAAQASGALAVLRSRFPAMPMPAVAALLLRTADDLGAQGVDRVYGHGALNLGAAVATQGDMDLVIGLNNVSVRALVTGAATGSAAGTLSTLMIISGAPSVAMSNNIAVSVSDLPAAAAVIQNPGTYHTVQYAATPGLAAMRANAAYDRGYFGQGVTVGFISEYGLNPERDVLQNNLLPGLIISVSGDGTAVTGAIVSLNAEGELVTGTVVSEQSFYGFHGTGLAGLIAAGIAVTTLPMGVAPLAKIIPLQIHDSNGADELRIRQSYGRGRDAVTVAFSVALARGAQVVLSPWLPFTRPAASLRINYAKTSTEIASTVFVSGTTYVTNPIVAPDTITDGPPQNGILFDSLHVPMMSEVLESGYSTGIHSTTYYAALISNVGGMLRDRDAVVVVPSGDGGFNSVNGTIIVSLHGDIDKLSVRAANFAARGAFLDSDGTLLSITDANQPGIMAEAPLYNRDILGKWLVVTAIDDNRVIGRFANGCGSAMYWCLAAPGEGIPMLHQTDGIAPPDYGTDLAAAQASGALAVLRSRFPTMPMPAVAAILLRTADDLGAQGVDRVYGHGALNLGAAIAVQGDMDLMIGLNSVTVRLLGSTIVITPTVTPPPATMTTTTPTNTMAMTTTTPTNTMTMTTTTPTNTMAMSMTMSMTTPTNTATMAPPPPPPAPTADISVVLSNGVAVSALHLPAPAALQSVPAYNTAQYTVNAALEDIGAAAAFGRGYFGQGVTIAYVSEHAVNTQHPALISNYVNRGVRLTHNADGMVGSITATASLAMDRSGIGTGIAGAIIAITAADPPSAGQHESFPDHPMGVAPLAKLLPIHIDTNAVAARESDAVRVAISMALQDDTPIIFLPQESFAINSSQASIRINVDGENMSSAWRTDSVLPIMSELLGVGHKVGHHTPEYYASYLSTLGAMMRGEDAVVVLAAGDSGWNSENGQVGLNRRTADGTILSLTVSAVQASVSLRIVLGGITYVPFPDGNQPGIMAEAPLYNRDLLGKWVVVAATDASGRIRSYANGCGKAMYWCLSAQDGFATHSVRSGLRLDGEQRGSAPQMGSGTSAALAIGAMAVLRSRFPDMPMPAVAAILFKTADDLGAPGVDPVYGHGALNLGKAITVQGDVDLVVGINSVTVVTPPNPLSTITFGDSGVVLVSNNLLISAYGFPAPASMRASPAFNTLQFTVNAALNSIGARLAYDSGYFGQGVTVAFITDRAFNNQHTALRGNLVNTGVQFIANSLGVVRRANPSGDPDGFGTGVAGVIVAVTAAAGSPLAGHPMGAAPLAKLLPMQIGRGYAQEPHAISAAFEAAVQESQIVLLPWDSFTFAGNHVSVHLGGRGYVNVLPKYPPYLLDGDMPAMGELLDRGYRNFQNPLPTRQFYASYLAGLGGMIRNRDVVAVMPTGDTGWNSENGKVSATHAPRRGATTRVTIDAKDAHNSLYVALDDGSYVPLSNGDQPGIMAEAPHYVRDLAGKWMVVAAIDNLGQIRSYSNGCGRARTWCLSAPDEFITYSVRNGLKSPSEQDESKLSRGGSQAAALASGALAVLSSRFPGMPMQVVAAILFKTADDMGLPGVDSVYGHGRLNLGKAINVQGEVDLLIRIPPPPPPSDVGFQVLISNGVAFSVVNLPPPAEANRSEYGSNVYDANPGIRLIKAMDAYDRGYLGREVTIAYIGDGVNPSREGLRANLLSGISIGMTASGVFVTGTVVSDASGFGTGVAGLIAAAPSDLTTSARVLVGVAPQARVLPVRIGGNQAEVTAALGAAVARDAQIILAPWSPFTLGHHALRTHISGLDGRDSGEWFVVGAGPVMPDLLEVGYENGIHTQAYYDAFFSGVGGILEDKDTLVVVPAGNESWSHAGNIQMDYPADSTRSATPVPYLLYGDVLFLNTSTVGHIPSTVLADANQPGVMAEAPRFNSALRSKWMVAIGINADSGISSFSNGCGAARYWCIAAQAEGMNTHGSGTDNVQAPRNDTSYAAAQVSGALAVLRSRFPHMPMQAVGAILLMTADDLGEKGVDRVYGHGRVNLAKAIQVQGDLDLVIRAVPDPAPAPTRRTVAVTATGALSTVDIGGSANVMLSGGVAISASNLPAAAAVRSTQTYSSVQYADHQGLTLMRASVAYERGYFGQGVTIAYIGDGVNAANPRVSPNLLDGVSIGVSAGGVIVTGAASGGNTDESTGLAGLVVAVANAPTDNTHAIPMGAAPQAKLIPLKIHNGTGQARDAVTAAISVAIERGASIILAPWQAMGIPRDLAPVVDPFGGDSDYYAKVGVPVMPELLAQGYEPGDYTAEYFDGFISNIADTMRDKDVVVVAPSGNHGWNMETGRFVLNAFRVISGHTVEFNSTFRNLALFGEVSGLRGEGGTLFAPGSGNQPGILAESPLFNRELRGKVMAVVATDNNSKIRTNSNGCGAAMYWCLAARDNYFITNPDGDGVFFHRTNTSFAAARASGALAVLSSRFPGMPMQAVAAILFKTADDLGAPGVDPVYGHGRLNLGAAITVQGDVDLVVGIGGVPPLAPLTSTVSVMQEGTSTGSPVSTANEDDGEGGGTASVTATDTTAAAAATGSAGSTGLRLSGLSRTYLGTGFGKMGDRLRTLPIAVSYLGGAYYYENALSEVTEFDGEDLTSLGNAAADMFGASRRIRTAQGFSAVSDERSGRLVRAGMVGDNWRVGYDICTECDEESWRMEGAEDHAGDAMGNVFFGANEQGAGAAWSPAMISPSLDGVEFFSAVGLGEDAEENTYQQYGLRWRGDVSELSGLSGLSAFSGFSLLAEWSHIEEGDSLLGSHGDVLGVDSASSRQARLELQGALPGALSNWRIHGGYTQGWADADLNGMGLITEMSNLRYAHWHVESSARNLLQGADELRFGLSGAPRITGDVHFRHYRAGEAVLVEDLQFALPNTVREERFTMHELSDNALIWRLGYKWRVTERQGVMDAALGWEAVSGSGANAGDHAASFQLRWAY